MAYTATSHSANETLNRIETEDGIWTSYGNDGRLTVGSCTAIHQEDAGIGCRARFKFLADTGDYGWGPLASTAMEAIMLCMAEFIATQAEVDA